VKIDLNADIGESYGRWTLGNDAELMPFLSSANIACGFLILERAKRARDPDEVATRAVMLATRGQVPGRDGGSLVLAARSVCVHGDADNAPAIARRVRERLLAAGVEVTPLRALV